MEKHQIYAQNQGDLTKDDRLKLAELLIKAGYTVRMVRRPSKSGKTYVHAVEFWTEDLQK